MICKIGEKIRTLRLQKAMTQEQLAECLGISYQSVSRWENGVTYPDIEFLPTIAKLFSVSTDYLLGQNEDEKKTEIRRGIHSISDMDKKDLDRLIELIRICRREQDNGEYFRDICYSLRYSSLHKNSAVLEELRKSKEIFFDTCSDAEIRSEALGYYACLEEEHHIKGLLDRYASHYATDRDYLLKERYLFRDEFERFETSRQRYLHKQIAYLIDGDISLWRDSSKAMEAEYTLFENNSKLALLHSVCQESPTEEKPITCGNAPDVFATQRIYIGMRQVCAYAYLGENAKAYAVLDDIIQLIEQLLSMPDGSKLRSTSPALNILEVTIKANENGDSSGCRKYLLYTLENGEQEMFGEIFPQSELECLTTAEYARWGWLHQLRKEEHFLELIERLSKTIKSYCCLVTSKNKKSV